MAASVSSSEMKIIIDNRERSLIELWDESADPEMEISALPVADVIIQKGEYLLMIERKTECDLISSIKDGRYSEQKQRLIHERREGKANHIMYIVEKSKRISLREKGLCRSAIMSMILRDRISVIRSESISDTRSLLKLIVKKLDTPKFYQEITKSQDRSESDLAGRIFTRKAKKSSRMTPRVCFISQLAQVPGVSEKMAVAIAEVYPNMTEILNAEKDDLSEIRVNGRRIGKKGERIYDFLHYL